jgi:hypothetical protein
LLPLQAQLRGSFIEKGLQLKSPFTIQQFTNRDGLPQSQVYQIVSLNDGAVLLSTGVAPVIFDGNTIRKILSPQEEAGYNRRIWYSPKFNTAWGINNRDRRLKSLYPVVRDLGPKNVSLLSLFFSGDSLILLDTKADLYSYFPNNDSYHRIGNLAKLEKPEFFRNLHSSVLNGSLLYFQLAGGVYCYDFKTKTKSQISTTSFEFMTINPYTNMLMGINNWEVIDILNQEKVVRKLPITNPDALPLSICFPSKDEYIIGTSRGLCFVYEDFEELYNKADGLPSEYCYSLYFDQALNCLYVGTGEKGLLKLQFKTNFSFGTDKNFRSASSIVRLHDGKVVFVSEAKQIRQMLTDTSIAYISKGAFFASLAEIDGLIYAGTWGEGVKIYRNKELIDSISSPKIANLQVLACFKSKDGTIWIGCVNRVSTGKDVKSIQQNHHLDIKGEVISFYELRDSTVCVGTTTGAYFIKNDKIVFYFSKKNGFKGAEIRCFYEDKNGKIWMGSYGGGLFVKDKAKITSISDKKNCMLDRDVFCLAPDGQGYLYSTSNHGLWRISEKNLDDFYHGKSDYLVPFYYGEQEGILNTEFNGGFQNNYLESKGSHFYFPSIEGVVMTMPEQLINRGLKPKIDAVFVNDTVFTGTEFNFSRKTTSIRIDFSCTNLSVKQNIYFQHKLLGGSSVGWSLLDRDQYVTLQLLPPGQYTFVVRAIDGFNELKPTETKLVFSVAPYFYETTWFFISSILLFILITTISAYYYSKYQRNRDAEKERYSRHMAEIEIKAIQAQLNPHFVFNCLNTIKSLILQKDFDTANKSLNTFSSLTREMLENSDKIFIPFLQNLKFCTDYIQLEKLRFQELFDYDITYDLELNSNPLIPHQLIQPYIENAIKHGLAHIENKKGILTVQFTKTAEGIICFIKDNGIGRLASRKINEHRAHHSRGTRLTVEKSEFLKRYIDYHCNIEVKDLFDEEGESAGTEIIITMPNVYESWSN